MGTREFWEGDFGTAYTDRNRVDWRARMPFWRQVIEHTGARSVHEVGCNAGWNLSAIRQVDPHVQLYGNDINEHALKIAANTGLSVVKAEIGEIAKDNERTIELVFTAGVLIHIAPEDLKPMMEHIASLSCKYVLAIEYEAEQEEEVEYRGHAGKLWRRPFGKLYEDLGLTVLNKSHAGPGFDNCTAWLMQVPVAGDK